MNNEFLNNLKEYNDHSFISEKDKGLIVEAIISGEFSLKDIDLNKGVIGEILRMSSNHQ